MSLNKSATGSDAVNTAGVVTERPRKATSFLALFSEIQDFTLTFVQRIHQAFNIKYRHVYLHHAGKQKTVWMLICN